MGGRCAFVSQREAGEVAGIRVIEPDVPVVNQFEYFYRGHGSDLDFRPEWPVGEEDLLRTRTRNAMVLLDLEYCSAGYSPTFPIRPAARGLSAEGRGDPRRD